MIAETEQIAGATKAEPKTDFARIVELIDEYSSISNELKLLEATLSEQVMSVVSDNREEYAALQETLTKAEMEMEQIAKAHPEWFVDKRTIKTPFGSVSLKRSSKLNVANEEATLTKIELRAAKDKEFKMEQYIRTKPELNLEALEKLDDATLKVLGIVRVEEENFNVKPVGLDMGKAVKEVEAKEKKASKKATAAAA